MSGLLYFIFGLLLGGFSMLIIMCSIQINRVNELEKTKNYIDVK